MKKDRSILSEPIGVITQILDDQTLCFTTNNNVRCQISDIVAVRSDRAFVLAKVQDIEVQFYVDNVKQYFVSKAVDNNLLKTADQKPRYAQLMRASILGHYETGKGFFKEIPSLVNRYTSQILQEVYHVPFTEVPEIYGLANPETSFKEDRIFDLGYQAYPAPITDEPCKLYFDLETFKRHTLITGVTGAGKSRLAALLVQQLVRNGAHVSVLDPHDEYATILEKVACTTFKFSSSELNGSTRINFFENALDAATLTQLMPMLSTAQETLVYEKFSGLTSGRFSTKEFMELLLGELTRELSKEAPRVREQVRELQQASDKSSRNQSEFISLYTAGLRRLYDLEKSSRTGVIIAVLSKVVEMVEDQLISNFEPNWLKEGANTVDLFHLDYSTNEYIRRYINSLIRFFLRLKPTATPRIVIIDEAHLLLRDAGKTADLVKQLLREGRKFGIALVFVSQNTVDVPDEIRSQFQNYFQFREDGTETGFYPDQVCQVRLYGSKSPFAIRVKTV